MEEQPSALLRDFEEVLNCQFVEYTDATFQIIAAVSNVTDTLVVR